MRYLVDANVLSEPTKPFPDRGVQEWLVANEEDLVVDPIILGEIQLGVHLLPRGRKRERLEQWFQTLVDSIECLAWDEAVGLRWGELIAKVRLQGQALPILDSMIAATALAHDLTVATRNVRDFKKSGVRVLNPFSREGWPPESPLLYPRPKSGGAKDRRTAGSVRTRPTRRGR